MIKKLENIWGDYMSYNVIDLIDKAIKVCIRKKALYEDIAKRKCEIPSIEIVASILIKQINKTIMYYEKLKDEADNDNVEEIAISVYDRISFLINEFNNKIYEPHINNVRQFLEFSLTSEQDIYSLFIDIQGRLVKNTSDINTSTYKILSGMINNKAEFISTLEKLIK